MVEFLLLAVFVALMVIAKRLARIAHILRNFKIEAVIPVYETDDDPEPTAAPTLPDNIVRGSFGRRVNR